MRRNRRVQYSGGFTFLTKKQFRFTDLLTEILFFASTTASIIPSSSSNRLIFTKEDGETIRSLFLDMIQGDMNIRAAVVIETIKSNKPEMFNRYTETRVLTEKRAYNRRNKKSSF